MDLIEPGRGDPKYKTLFYKIQAKHVDFVVDPILKDVGYTVIRTRSVTDNTLDSIKL